MIESLPPFLGIDRIWKPKASIFRGDLPGTHAHTNTREISRMERYRLGRRGGAGHGVLGLKIGLFFFGAMKAIFFMAKCHVIPLTPSLPPTNRALKDSV